MSAAAPKIPSVDIRFGEWLNRGFQAFFEQWQPWVAQILIAAGVSLAAFACCFFPAILVAGPLSCGLHYCGLLTVRRQPINSAALGRGWQLAGRSMIANLALSVMQIGPAVVLYVLFTGAFMAMAMSGALAPGGARPMGGPGRIIMEDFSIPDDGAPLHSPDKVDAERPMEAEEIVPGSGGTGNVEIDFDFDPQTDELDEQAGSVAFGAPMAGRPMFGPRSPFGPQEMKFLGMFFLLYGLMLLGILAMALWAIWFGTKTMYVMPLIADRGCSFLEAFTESWRLTKTRFWELLLVYFLALIISGIGAYFCYVGLLATLPLYYTIIGAAYEAHALPQFVPDDDPCPVPV
ncbi:MAG: hypothetical protein EXS05_08320 [Planctomycetaceae bacterium]|nr:hypothetical protein [Planctomycetaceae bacterium]